MGGGRGGEGDSEWMDLVDLVERGLADKVSLADKVGLADKAMMEAAQQRKQC